jgi:hypothetical protein
MVTTVIRHFRDARAEFTPTRFPQLAEDDDRKVIPFEPLRVQQIRERLKELDAEALNVIDERIKLENELQWLGYRRD